MSNSSIWPIHRTLSGSNTPDLGEMTMKGYSAGYPCRKTIVVLFNWKMRWENNVCKGISPKVTRVWTCLLWCWVPACLPLHLAYKHSSLELNSPIPFPTLITFTLTMPPVTFTLAMPPVTFTLAMPPIK